MGAPVATTLSRAKRRYRSATGSALGGMNLHNVYADGQLVAGLDEAGKLDVQGRMTGFSNADAGKSQAVVQAGETARTLAQRIYGNGNLWYVIVDANALSVDPDTALVAGESLAIPEVRTSSNDANTFKPYNPGEITGPTTPGLPYIPPADAGCNMIAAVVRVVVTAVLMANPLTWGAAAAFAGIGEGVAQTIEISGGQRQGYDWGGVAMSAVSAAGYGNAGARLVEGAAKSLGPYSRLAVSAAASAAVNYAGGQAINRIAGEDVHFSWRELAVDAVSSAITAASLNGVSPRASANGIATNRNTLPSFSWKAMAVEAVQSVGRQGVGHAVRDAVIGDAHWDWRSVLRNAAQDVAIVGLAGQLAKPNIERNAPDINARIGAQIDRVAEQAMQNLGLRQPITQSIPEFEISLDTAGAENTRSVLRTVSPEVRYETRDGTQWVDMPRLARDEPVKNLATGEWATTTPTLSVVPDASSSQDFMSLWGYARSYGAPAPASASAMHLQQWRGTVGTQMHDQYNRWTVQNQAYYRSLPEFGTYTRRGMTNAEFSEWRARDNMAFLKFMSSTAVLGILPAAAAASPIAGAALSGWGLGSSVNSFREGNYVLGTIEAVGSVLGFGVVGAQLRQAKSISDLALMPLGPPGVRGALSSRVTSWGDLGVPNGMGEAHNAAIFAKYKEVLSVSERANPLVDSLRSTGRLPDHFVTKEHAASLGWRPGKALEKYIPGGQLGGDVFHNTNALVPPAPGRIWREADIGLNGAVSRPNQPGTRLLYSNDGHMYVTADHYKTAYPFGGQ